jgi:hypothetical protein
LLSPRGSGWFELKAKANERTEKSLASLGLDNAIRLRWALRDIKGKRLKLTPVDPNDMRTLIDLGYVEMINDQPVVTAAGSQQIEIGD